MLKYIFSLLSSFWCLFSCNAQQLSYQISPVYGYKFQRKNFFTQPISGLTLDINRTTNGIKYWQSDHKFPQMGLQFMMRDFDKQSPHRLTFSAVPYLEFNILKSNLGRLQIKHGTGLAFVAGHKKGNVKSLLGTKLNASSVIDLGYSFNSKGKFNVKPGLLLSHVSNGNLVSPNKGINAVFAYFQMAYCPKKLPVNYIHNRKIFPGKRWRPEYRLSFGLYDYVKEEKKIGLKLQHLVMQTYLHNTRFRTGLGTEFMHDAAFDDVIISVYAEESVLIGHLVTRYGLGIYVNDIPVNSSRIYEKVGLAWLPFKLHDSVGQGLSIGTDIKAHKFKAVMIDVYVGYLF